VTCRARAIAGTQKPPLGGRTPGGGFAYWRRANVAFRLDGRCGRSRHCKRTPNPRGLAARAWGSRRQAWSCGRSSAASVPRPTLPALRSSGRLAPGGGHCRDSRIADAVQIGVKAREAVGVARSVGGNQLPSRARRVREGSAKGGRHDDVTNVRHILHRDSPGPAPP
jgi:hypothetical protein